MPQSMRLYVPPFLLHQVGTRLVKAIHHGTLIVDSVSIRGQRRAPCGNARIGSSIVDHSSQHSMNQFPINLGFTVMV